MLARVDSVTLASAEPPSAPVPIRPIVALSFGACGSAAALRICDPLLPWISARYDVGIGAAAQTVTAFAIAYGLLQLAYGPIGDRYGKYRVAASATFASALTSLACAVAPDFGLLVFARMLAGATAGGLIPLSLAWIGDVVPYQWRQPVLARFLMGQMFGLAFGQLLGGLGADYFGATPVFFALAAWFAVAAGLMWRFAPPRPPPRDRDASTRGVVAPFAAVLQVRWARIVLGTVFLEGLLLLGAMAFIPTHLHRAYGLPLTVAASIVMLYAVGGLIYAALARTLVRSLGEAGLALGGAVLLAVCFATIAIGQVVTLAALACLLAGLGFYMLHTTLQVNATQMAPAERGSSIALFATCLFIGQSTGVTLAGYAAERFGTGIVILGGGAMLLVLGVVFGAVRRRHTPSS